MSVVAAHCSIAINIASLAVEIRLAVAKSRRVIARAMSGTIRTLFVLTLITIIRCITVTTAKWIASAVIGAIRSGNAKGRTILRKKVQFKF